MDNILKNAIDKYISNQFSSNHQQSSQSENQSELDAPLLSCTANTTTNQQPIEKSKDKKTENRLSGLLHKIKNKSKNKAQILRKGKTRKVQIKWQRYNERDEDYIYVKAKDGGGSRFPEINEDATLNDLKTKAVELYFDNDGKNPLGESADSTIFKIASSAGVELELTEKLSTYLARKGLLISKTYFILRSETYYSGNFDFHSNDNNDNNSNAEDNELPEIFPQQSQSLKRKICPICSVTMGPNETNFHMCSQNAAYQSSLMFDSSLLSQFQQQSSSVIPPSEHCLISAPLNNQNNTYPTSSNQFTGTINELSLPELRNRRLFYLEDPKQSTRTLNDPEQSAVDSVQDPVANSIPYRTVASISTFSIDPEQPAAESTPEFAPQIPSTSGPLGDSLPSRKRNFDKVTIHRMNVKKDLLDFFCQNKIVEGDSIRYVFIDEKGQEEKGVGIGVIRDVYSSFWKDIADSHFIGEAERVPIIRHDLFKDEWSAIGGIYVKGYVDVGYVPLMISRSFIEFCLFNRTNEDNLIESFKRYVSPDERELLEKALKKDDAEIYSSDEMLDMLELFKCRSQMTSENATDLIKELARQELIQKPYIMASCWSNSFENLKKKEDFTSIKTIKALYDKVEPTPRKVIQLFVCSPKDDPERDALAFLKRYVRGLDSTQLKQFLRFTTGNEIITVSKIDVSFNKNYTSSFSRRPIAHTCSPLLEIPSTYANFCELREDFSNILLQNNWFMDIV